MPGKGQYTRTKEEYLAALMAKHGDRFAIKDFEYKGASTPIVAHCSQHGPFEILLADLITSSRGCQSCPAAEPPQKYKRTRQEYAELIQAKYGGELLIVEDASNESEYKGAQTLVTVRCLDHGLFTGRLGKLLDGAKKCPECRITTRGKYKRSKEEYLSLIEAKHGSKFTIRPFEYKGGETMIEVECPDHGLFQKKIDKLLQDKHGCPKCALASSALVRSKNKTGVPNKAKRVPVELAIARITLPDNITADFSKYESWSQGEVSTVCEFHGPKTWINAHALQQSNNRCPSCGSTQRSRTKNTSWPDFVARARTRFGARFEYSDDYGYVNLSSDVSIICSEHGPQKIKATKHVVHGQYCAECRFEYTKTSGLLPGLYAEVIPFDEALQATPGRLYYFQHGTKFKIGITKNTMQKRLKGQPQRERVTRVESVEMTMGEALAIEQYTLLKFAEHRIARNWSTELFDRDVLSQFGHASLESYVAWFRENENAGLILSELAQRIKRDEENTADSKDHAC